MSQLSFKIIGESNLPNLILLHGWGRSYDDFTQLAEILSDRYCCHLIDLPGFGSSDVPDDGVWGTKDYADAILQYMDFNQIHTASFAGHSFGGRVSIYIAANFQDRVEKLFLLNSAGLKPIWGRFKTVKLNYIKALGKTCKFLDSVFATTLFKDVVVSRYGSADYKNSGKLKDILVKTVNEDLSDQLLKIESKTTLIWGKLDQDTPIEVAHRMKRSIVNSDLIVLENHSHDILLGVSSHLVAKIIIEKS